MVSARQTVLGRYKPLHEMSVVPDDLEHTIRSAYLRIPGLTFSPVDWQSTSAKFDLTLSLAETSDGFAGALEHSAETTDLLISAPLNR